MDDFLHSLIFYFYVCTIIQEVFKVPEDMALFLDLNLDQIFRVREDIVEAEGMEVEESHKLWTTQNL